jgi:hypothetical protein
MKVVIRNSSLLFFLISVFFGLPVHRRHAKQVTARPFAEALRDSR